MSGERLAKLILMLSSDSDGEVVAAVRALGRALTAEGKDWHWLASRVSRPSSAGTGVEARRRADPFWNERSRSSHDWSSQRADINISDAERWALELDGINGLLENDSEREFVANIAAKFRRFGYSTFISPKQYRWLMSLHARHVEAGDLS